MTNYAEDHYRDQFRVFMFVFLAVAKLLFELVIV